MGVEMEEALLWVWWRKDDLTVNCKYLHVNMNMQMWWCVPDDAVAGRIRNIVPSGRRTSRIAQRAMTTSKSQVHTKEWIPPWTFRCNYPNDRVYRRWNSNDSKSQWRWRRHGWPQWTRPMSLNQLAERSSRHSACCIRWLIYISSLVVVSVTWMYALGCTWITLAASNGAWVCGVCVVCVLLHVVHLAFGAKKNADEL